MSDDERRLAPQQFERLPTLPLETLLLLTPVNDVLVLAQQSELLNRRINGVLPTQQIVQTLVATLADVRPDESVPEWLERSVQPALSALTSGFVVNYWHELLQSRYGIARMERACKHPTAAVRNMVANALDLRVERKRIEIVGKALFAVANATQSAVDEPVRTLRSALLDAMRNKRWFLAELAALLVYRRYFLSLYTRRLVDLNDITAFDGYNALHYASPEFCVLALPVERATNGQRDDDDDDEATTEESSSSDVSLLQLARPHVRSRQQITIAVFLLPTVLALDAFPQDENGTIDDDDFELLNDDWHTNSLLIDVWTTESFGGNMQRIVSNGVQPFSLGNQRMFVAHGLVPSLAFETGGKLVYGVAFNERQITPNSLSANVELRNEDFQLAADVVGSRYVRFIDFNGYLVQHVVRMAADWQSLHAAARAFEDLTDARPMTARASRVRAQRDATNALLLAVLPNQLFLYAGEYIYTLHYDVEDAFRLRTDPMTRQRSLSNDWITQARVERRRAPFAVQPTAGAVSGVVQRVDVMVRNGNGNGDEQQIDQRATFQAYVVTSTSESNAAQHQTVVLEWQLLESNNYAVIEPYGLFYSSPYRPPVPAGTPAALLDELLTNSLRRRELLLMGERMRWRLRVPTLVNRVYGTSMHFDDNAMVQYFIDDRLPDDDDHDESDANATRNALEMPANRYLDNAQIIATSAVVWSEQITPTAPVAANTLF